MIVVVALGLGLAVRAALENVFALQADPHAPDTIGTLVEGIAVIVAAAGLGAFGLIIAGWLLTGQFLWLRSPLSSLRTTAENFIYARAARQRVRWVIMGAALFLVLDLAVLVLASQVTRVSLILWSSSPGVGTVVATVAGEALMIGMMGGLVAIQVVYFRSLRSISSKHSKWSIACRSNSKEV
ncbi:MAG: hypothetical protein AB1543_06215 [Candidatus Bipolaricaulota bacterium]